MIDMSELMSDPDFVQPEPVSVLRTEGWFDGSGLYDTALPSGTIAFMMIVQQSTPAQLMALPEGERDGDFITCWAHDQLIVADGVTYQQSDVVLWREKQYRVVRCADRSDNGFWEAIAQYAPATGGTGTLPTQWNSQ
jgi:hypothetical protein